MSDWYVAESKAYGVSIRTKARTFRPIVAKNSPTRTEDGYVATRMKRDEAELTVRAVNAHDALLEAAEAAEPWITGRAKAIELDIAKATWNSSKGGARETEELNRLSAEWDATLNRFLAAIRLAKGDAS